MKLFNKTSRLLQRFKLSVKASGVGVIIFALGAAILTITGLLLEIYPSTFLKTHFHPEKYQTVIISYWLIAMILIAGGAYLLIESANKKT